MGESVIVPSQNGWYSIVGLNVKTSFDGFPHLFIDFSQEFSILIGTRKRSPLGDSHVKVTICKNCGLTMCTGVTKCRRCKNKSVEPHDIMCDTDTYRLHRRLSQLSVDRSKKHASQFYSAVLVLSMTSLGLMGYDCYKNPNGAVATQAKELLSLLPSSGSSVATRKSPGSL